MRIPLSRPDITDIERRTVNEVLLTPHLALGPRLLDFENSLAAYHEREHAIAVNSGTSALHLAMLALGVESGDEVITTPFSFISSTNCILYANGVPRFVDIDPETWNLDIDALESALTPRTVGILPVHVFGLPCDMNRINSFAKKHNLWIVEDACEAIGARYNGCGVGKNADISSLAFYPNKQITTGEGGVVLTDNPEIAELCRSLRNQGRAGNGSWLDHVRLGYNYRMSDIAAALGLAQLGRIDEILAKRSRVAAMYKNRLNGCEWLSFQESPNGASKSWFVFVVKLADEFQRDSRDAIMSELRENGIGCSNYFTPIHLQPFLRVQFGYRPGDWPVCESVSDRTLALPFYGDLSEIEVEHVCDLLLSCLEREANRITDREYTVS